MNRRFYDLHLRHVFERGNRTGVVGHALLRVSANDHLGPIPAHRVDVGFLFACPADEQRILSAVPGCKDNLKLTKDEMKAIKSLGLMTPKDSKDLHDHLVQRLEVHQLADKTETQREYLKAEL